MSIKTFLIRIYNKTVCVAKEHSVAVVLMLSVGLIFSLPGFLAQASLGDSYKGVPFLYQSDDIKGYLTNINEVVDGHSRVSSPVYGGFKDSPSTILPIGEYLYALPSIVFGIDIPTVININKFLFPALLFLLAYSIVFLMTKEVGRKEARLSGVAAGLMIVLGFDLIDYRYIFTLFDRSTTPLYSVIWARLVNPITGGIFLLSYLILLWKIFTGGSYKYAITAGVIGLLMSGYFFSHGIALSITSVLLVVVLLQKRYKASLLIGTTLFLTFLPLAGQFFSALLGGRLTGEGSELARIGLLHTHTIVFNKLLFVAILSFGILSLYYFVKQKRILSLRTDLWWWFSLSLLAGSFIVYIQQIVTGLTIWPAHFVQYSIPIVIIVAFVMFHKVFVTRFKYIWLAGIFVVILSSISYGVWTMTFYKVHLDDFENSQRYKSAFNWINENTNKDCVVHVVEYDSIDITSRVPAFTHCNVYYSQQNFYGVPVERVLHGYFAKLKLEGISDSEVSKFLNDNKSMVQILTYKDWTERYYYKNDLWLRSITDENRVLDRQAESIKKLVNDYGVFYKKDLEVALKEEQLDFIIWDTKLYPEWNHEHIDFIDQVFSDEDVVIFKVL